MSIFLDEGFSLWISLIGLTSSSWLLSSQRFGRLILRPSSGASRTREPSVWNFEPNPLLLRGYHVLVPLRPSLLLLLLDAIVAAAVASIIVVTALVCRCHCLCSGLNSEHRENLQSLFQRPSRLGHVSLGRSCMNFWYI